MKTIRRLFVIIAFVLIIGGIGLVTIYGIKTGFKFKEELVTKTHENLASYESMDLDIEIADVEFINSDSFKVVCVETEKGKLIMLENLLESLMQKFEITQYKKLKTFKGKELEAHLFHNNLSAIDFGEKAKQSQGFLSALSLILFIVIFFQIN